MSPEGAELFGKRQECTQALSGKEQPERERQPGLKGVVLPWEGIWDPPGQQWKPLEDL